MANTWNILDLLQQQELPAPSLLQPNQPVVQPEPKAPPKARMPQQMAQPQMMEPQPAQAAPQMPDGVPIAQAFAQDLGQRKAYINQLRQSLAQSPKSEDGFDFQSANLKPLLAFADSLTGSRSAQAYDAPTNKKELEKQKLMQLLDKEQQAVADDQINYLKLQELVANNDEKIDAKKQFLELYDKKISTDRGLGYARLNETASKGEKISGDAAKAGGFARRIQQSEEVFNNLLNNGYQGPTRQDQARSILPRESQSTQYRSYDQATRNFINATLRRESGAAISEGEFSNAREQYLPQPGDPPQILAQKKANRMQVFESLKAEGGTGFERIPYVSPTSQKVDSPTVIVRQGSETLEIPRSDLKDAIRAGYREVR